MFCWKCGKEDATETRGYGKRAELGCLKPFPYQRHYCKPCLEQERADQERMKREYVILKKKLMFERALTIIEKSGTNIYDYREEIDTIEEFINEKPDKFDTAHEMVVAIMLLANRINMKIQHRVDSYTVDFLLPDERIVLEVDGGIHATNAYRDNTRDIRLREVLGNEWEVVRIGNEYVEQNPEFVLEAMMAIKREKQDIRRKNFGMMPEWYSRRERATKPKKSTVTVGDDKLLNIK